MKKCLFLLAALMLTSFAASAQTCDMTMSMDWQYKGKSKLTNTVVYHDLTAADAQGIMQRSQSVLDTASKAQDKGGDYAFNFDGTNTCGITAVPIVTPGLSHADSMKVMRQAFGKAAEGHIQTSEQHVKKGHKGPWGNDDGQQGNQGGKK
jgi:hypothetical protein